MTTAEAHKSDGIGKDLVVYVCLLALAGLQFVIAYQNIDASQMFSRMLMVACVEAGLAVTVLHASLGGKAGLSVVCRHLYDFCPAGDAIWVDRLLPHGDRRAIFKMSYVRERHGGEEMLGRELQGELRANVRVERPFLLVGVALVGLVMLCRPAPGLRAELRALLYAGCLRRRSNDSGLAQWHSDSYRASDAYVGWHDFHCSSQTQSVQAIR